ncbi:putative adhesion G protein-coupled receptor E4P [Callorhinchus milii]|nr:putative adhesion G protein-coupled receptor E4P [Callorhinchus milii]|eukprot:gi/632977446/ref/XP_007905348.1/ PREDICTED: putative EGF-like module-containing mucin-like hormone receptor-like 4 [Callorhinchus milii]
MKSNGCKMILIFSLLLDAVNSYSRGMGLHSCWQDFKLNSTILQCLSLKLEDSTNRTNYPSSEKSRQLFRDYLESLEEVIRTRIFNSKETKRKYLENIGLASMYVNRTKLGSEQAWNLHVGGNEMQVPWKLMQNLSDLCVTGIYCAFVESKKLDLLFTRGNDFLDQSDINLTTNAAQPGTVFRFGSNVVTGLFNANTTSAFSLPISFVLLHAKNITGNGTRLCAYWNRARQVWADDGCRTVELNATHTICNAYHLSSFVILVSSSEQDPDIKYAPEITFGGLSVSLVCLSISIFTFLKCQSIQSNRTTIHLHLSLCLFLAYLIFLVFVNNTSNQVGCLIVAALLHYLFLAVFVWMLLEGVVLYLMVVMVFHISSLRGRYVYAVGYGLPAVLVSISASIQPTIYETKTYCWLAATPSAAWYFGGPVCFIVLVNLVVFSITLWKLTQKISSLVPNASKLKKIRAFVGTAVAQLFLLGITWIFGIVHFIRASTTIAYLFIITNVFQGASIFIFHCLLNKQVRDEYRKWFSFVCRSQRAKAQSTSVQSTSIPQ